MVTQPLSLKPRQILKSSKSGTFGTITLFAPGSISLLEEQIAMPATGKSETKKLSVVSTEHEEMSFHFAEMDQRIRTLK